MKMRARIIEEVKPGDKSIIVQFHSDKENQHFEVHCDFDPVEKDMHKWASWDLNIKWLSEIFTEPKTGVKSYFTHLHCTEATLFMNLGDVAPEYRS